MNRIYKVIYSKAHQCYIVVSELAKRNHKSSQPSIDHSTPALARIIALALTAGALTWGSTPGISWAANNTAGSGDGVAVGTGSSAPKAENVAIGKGSTISYSGGASIASTATGDIVIGGGAHINNYINQGGGIAIGANSFVENIIGGLERAFDFNQAGFKTIPFIDVPYGDPNDPTKMVTGVAIGQNTYARSGSIMLGTHNYKGDLGDVTVDSAKTKAQNMSLFSTTLGANSYSNGLFSSVTGAYSIASSDYSGGEHASKNFGATITGSLNSIESATSSNEYSGVANSIVGLANRTSNSNGSLIFGAGNEIKNSITNISAPTSGGNSSKALQDRLMNAVKNGESGGATLVIGGGNTADYTQKTQILGVKNTVTGTEDNISMYNMIDGFNNTVNGASHLYTIGTNNTITNAKNTILFGDNRKAEGVENSVIIGNADETAPITTSNKDTVILGHNANATVDGGAAIGAGSVASRKAGVAGYDPATKKASEETSAIWKATDAAVSVGKADGTMTRQITGVAAGLKDTDAVNVAQLKQAVAGAKDGNATKDTRNTVKAGENVTLATKDNADGSHEYTVNVEADGRVAAGDTKLVSGETVYNETRVQQDGTYVKKDKTAGENITALDNQVANNTQSITNINGRVNNLDSKINKVGAGAAALAALHPLDFDPDDKWDFAVGYGNYRDANSAAVGAFYRPDEDTMFSLGTNFGNGENMINAGVSFKFGPKGKSQVRPGSTQEITELRATVARQDDQLKKQDSEIKELKAMVQQLLAAQDKKTATK